MAWDRMPTFKSLSYGDRWRVLACLRRGRAPDDPRMAAAVVEYAEGLDQSHWRGVRVFFLFVTGIAVAATIYFASKGDAVVATANGAFVAVALLDVMLVPGFWPRHVARSLEASRKKASATDASGQVSSHTH